MYLIPLNEAIYYNATQIDLSLVVLIAFAYHPTSANILYLFYGIMSTGLGGPTYSQFQFLVRDSNTGSFLQNTTIMQAYGCEVNCEMKATQNLLLIQSETVIGIYPLNNINYQITTIPILTSPKYATNQITQIHRWGDINANNFFIATSVNNCIFGQYDSSGSGLTTSQNYSMNLNIADILYVSMKSNMVYIVVNSSSVSFIFFDCLTCAFSNTIASLNQNNTFVVRTNISTSSAFRLYQGTVVTDSPLTNAMVYWGFKYLGISWKFIINSTHYQLAQFYNFNASYTIANKQHYFLFDLFYQVVFRSFKYVSTSTQNQTSTYFGYSFFSLSVDKAIISTDSVLVAVTTFDSDWKIHQFELVSNCSSYNATINSANGLFCDCNLYDSNHRCTNVQNNSNSTSESKGSFPIVIVISVIVGVVAVVIAIITIKKNYRRCTKGRRRIPYVYNPVELMSFQV